MSFSDGSGGFISADDREAGSFGHAPPPESTDIASALAGGQRRDKGLWYSPLVLASPSAPNIAAPAPLRRGSATPTTEPEAGRDGGHAMNLGHDVRFTVRQWSRRPGFAAVAILMRSPGAPKTKRRQLERRHPFEPAPVVPVGRRAPTVAALGGGDEHARHSLRLRERRPAEAREGLEDPVHGRRPADAQGERHSSSTRSCSRASSRPCARWTSTSTGGGWSRPRCRRRGAGRRPRSRTPPRSSDGC
jgi:hypothetical protein